MRALQDRRVAYSRPLAELALTPWVLLPLAALLGAFVAFQFFHLTPRYIKLVFGGLFLLAVTRLPFHYALALFLVLFVAPTFVFVGDTNVIFIGLTAVIWLIRMTLGAQPRRIRTPIDWAILVYLGIHLLSFVNITELHSLSGARENMAFMVAGALLYTLMVNAFRTEAHLSLALKALCITALFVDVTAIAEYYFGVRLVPLWFIYNGATGSRFEEGGRAGGVFGFHGLLADFSAMMFYLQMVLGLRTRSRWAKLYYYGLAALSLLNIVNSANRGGLVIWVVGGLYFLWFRRRQIRWTRVALASPLIGAAVALAGVISQKVLYRLFLFSRLASTQFKRGVPENRVEVWQDVISRIPEHPWLGHGPFIDLRRGVTREMHWPHNAYLFYLYTTGVAGLLAYLWILVKVLWKSFPRGGVDFVHGSLGKVTQALFHIQVVMFALAQMRDEHQRGNVYIYLMWILFALAMIGTRLSRPSPALPAPVEPEIRSRELPGRGGLS